MSSRDAKLAARYQQKQGSNFESASDKRDRKEREKTAKAEKKRNDREARITARSVTASPGPASSEEQTNWQNYKAQQALYEQVRSTSKSKERRSRHKAPGGFQDSGEDFRLSSRGESDRDKRTLADWFRRGN